jgi:hypothetical protein
MHRAIIYDAQMPQAPDVLNTNKFGMQGLAYALWAILGGNTVVHGLACTTTLPTATLNVVIAPGSIYAMDTMDATAYSDLGTDSTIVCKQGILNAPLTLTVTPPGTSGQSQVYLVEAALTDVDNNSMVVQYYNPANIFQPIQGPGGSTIPGTGTPQVTTRLVKCTVQLKAGVAATTGSEVAPAPDSGFVGLFTIDVPNGATAVTSAMIATLATAPFFPNLPAIPPGLQTSTWTYCVDTGAVNAMVGVVWPPVTALTPGQLAFVKAGHANTAATTFALGSTGAQPVHRANGNALSAADLSLGMVVALMWDGAAWQMLDFLGYTPTGTNTNTYTFSIPYAIDSGTPNNVIGNFAPAITSLGPGLTVEVQIGPNNLNTGASTLQCNVMAAKPIIRNGLALQPRDLLPNMICLFVYDGTSFELINARWPYTSVNDNAPPSADIYLAVGDQQNVSWTNLKKVPFWVATVPGVYEIDLVCTTPNASVDNDLMIMPNNNQYSGPGGGGQFTVWDLVGFVPPSQYGGNLIPAKQAEYEVWNTDDPSFNLGGPGWIGVFGFDLFDNPEPGNITPRNGNVGPFHAKFVVSTFTAAKAINCWAGQSGGPSVNYARWWDTTIPYTSLGTFALVSGDYGTQNLVPCSGFAVIRRRA